MSASNTWQLQRAQQLEDISGHKDGQIPTAAAFSGRFDKGEGAMRLYGDFGAVQGVASRWQNHLPFGSPPGWPHVTISVP
jgi:hypothetical protein